MNKVRFITFGCKVNTYETQCMRESFISAGYEEVSAGADVIVINSCTVTASADRKLLKCLRSLKRDEPSAVIVLTGCYPQTHGADPEGIAHIVTGTSERKGLPDLVRSFIEKRTHIESICPHTKGESYDELCINRSEGRTRAFVKIQDGCDMNCTYCTIPAARGHMRSKPADALRREITALAENGYSEIVLVGINIMFYGREYGLDIADAVETAAVPDNIRRVRISSIEPERMSDSVVKRLAGCSKFCPSFHLSLQSGSNRVLGMMKRRYDTNEYYSIVKKLREQFHDCSVTTDIMTGFPGETEEDHIDSMRFIEKVGFSGLHVFPYSERNGTPAALMDQVPMAIRHRRAREITELGNRLSLEYNNRFIGRIMDVIFEREGTNGIHHGHTNNYLVVRLDERYERSLRGETGIVRITSADKDGLYGSLVH